MPTFRPGIGMSAPGRARVRFVVAVTRPLLSFFRLVNGRAHAYRAGAQWLREFSRAFGHRAISPPGGRKPYLALVEPGQLAKTPDKRRNNKASRRLDNQNIGI